MGRGRGREVGSLSDTRQGTDLLDPDQPGYVCTSATHINPQNEIYEKVQLTIQDIQTLTVPLLV